MSSPSDVTVDAGPATTGAAGAMPAFTSGTSLIGTAAAVARSLRWGP